MCWGGMQTVLGYRPMHHPPPLPLKKESEAPTEEPTIARLSIGQTSWTHFTLLSYGVRQAQAGANVVLYT